MLNVAWMCEESYIALALSMLNKTTPVLKIRPNLSVTCSMYERKSVILTGQGYATLGYKRTNSIWRSLILGPRVETTTVVYGTMCKPFTEIIMKAAVLTVWQRLLWLGVMSIASCVCSLRNERTGTRCRRCAGLTYTSGVRCRWK